MKAIHVGNTRANGNIGRGTVRGDIGSLRGRIVALGPNPNITANDINVRHGGALER